MLGPIVCQRVVACVATLGAQVPAAVLSQLPLEQKVYVAGWLIGTLVAVPIVARYRTFYFAELKEYSKFLFVPWKLVTFLLSGGFFVLIAPYTPDPTWDRIDGTFMSLGAFFTAPWAVGTLYRVLRRRCRPIMAYPAIISWLWATSWSYDGYILWRDQNYPPSWWSNMIASGVLYACAGLFWSLEHRPNLGVTFTFLHEGWRPVSTRLSPKLVLLAVVLGGLVAAMMWPFVSDLLP